MTQWLMDEFTEAEDRELEQRLRIDDQIADYDDAIEQMKGIR